MLKLIFLICFSSFLIASGFFPKGFSLDGRWKYHVEQMPQAQNYVYDFKGEEPQMVLPNNWYNQGINHAGVMWFERTFSMKDVALARKHFLHFDGVDYLCDVWINGQYAGSHQGYFQAFELDITPFLRKGVNSVKVRVNSPLENYPEHYSLHKTLLRGIFAHHDTRPGGAWSAEGQDRNSGGIWNHISIQSYQQYKFEKLKVTPVVKKEMTSIDISATIKTLKNSLHHSFIYYHTVQEANENLNITLTPYNFKGKSYSQNVDMKNKNTINVKMRVKDAKLWYTHDRGFPHLYTLTLRYKQTQIQERIGLKSLVQDEDKVYHLNGEALYLKGTNYISSQYMSQMDEDKLKHDLELMKEAHINTIRVHAHVEPKRFYTLCDEMGFLVWQDYNLQWGYIDSLAFVNEAKKQLIEMIDMLYNHPSIFIWSMHNEPPWNSDWMKWKYADYNATQNKSLDDTLYALIQSYDTYHLNKKLSSNLEHPWFGWYSGKYTDFNASSKVPVITEYGAQALPSLGSLKKFIPQKYLLPQSKKAKKYWEYHNYQFDWSEKNGVKFKGDLPQFIHESQKYQADLIKYATEMLRIQKYSTTTGIFQFMFNEGWPSMNWGIVDYYRNPKMGYEALKRAYAPIIVVAKQISQKEVELYVVNDSLKTIENATLEVISKSLDEKEISIFPVDMGADSVMKVATVEITSLTSLSMRLKTDVKLADNKYIFNTIKQEVAP